MMASNSDNGFSEAGHSGTRRDDSPPKSLTIIEFDPSKRRNVAIRRRSRGHGTYVFHSRPSKTSKILLLQGGRELPVKSKERLGIEPEKDGESSISRVTKLKNPQLPLVSPNSALSKGNSDPFRSFAVNITPAVNNLLLLYRDYILRAEYSLGSKNWVSSPAARADWLNCVDSLSDICDASGFLAMTSTILNAIRPSKARGKQSLAYKTRSIVLLRQRMSQNPTSPPYRAMYFLLAAEVYGRNLAGAQLHATMMRTLFEKDLAEKGSVDFSVLTQAVYLDTQAAAMFLVQPTFDPEAWLPAVYERVWKYAEQVLPDMANIKSTLLDPTIESDTLKDLFKMHHKTHTVWATPSTEILSTPVALIWLASHNMICQGLAIKCYRSMAERYLHAEGDEFDRCCAEAYMSLADLYLARATGTSPTVGGVRLYDAESRILSTLRATLEDSEALFAHHVPSVKYANAKLWALYVGALAEQSPSAVATSSGSDPCLGWFNRKLARHAGCIGISSWQQMQPILEGFLYSDHIKPNGSEWFFKTLSVNLDL